jgi:hypothetical protein
VVEDHLCGGVGEDWWVGDGADSEAELQYCVEERMFLLRLVGRKELAGELTTGIVW